MIDRGQLSAEGTQTTNVRRNQLCFVRSAAINLYCMSYVDDPAPITKAHHAGPLRLAVVAIVLSGSCYAAAAESKVAAPDTAGGPVRLAAFNVKGEMLEDFGFRVSPDFGAVRSKGAGWGCTPVVDMVLPNTAASKAGVRPGDRIVVADGEETGSWTSALRKWRGIQKKKWAEVEEGKGGVIWTLQVETAGTLAMRTVTLQLPTPAPHWGSTVWRAPADRRTVVVTEPGPLAERAQQVLNNGIWMVLRASYVNGFKLPVDAAHPHFLCYQWTLWSGSTGHRMYVSQQRGRTDIILEAIAKDNSSSIFSGITPAATPDQTLSSATTALAIDSRTYLTSPSGVLEMAWRLPRSNHQEEIPRGLASAGFEAEVDFWLTKVGKVSSLWPLGVIASSPDVSGK